MIFADLDWLNSGGIFCRDESGTAVPVGALQTRHLPGFLRVAIPDHPLPTMLYGGGGQVPKTRQMTGKIVGMRCEMKGGRKKRKIKKEEVVKMKKQNRN